jgi:hypothetical protein
MTAETIANMADKRANLNPLLDDHLHSVEIHFSDEKSVVYIDDERIDDPATRLFVLGSAIFSAEIIPPKIWRQ